MAAKMKDWQIFKCPFCSCEYYDRTAKKGRNVGNPMIECPNCGEKSFRSTILEPALINGNLHFAIKFSSVYGNLRIGLILIYAVFLFIILVKKNLTMAVFFVAAAAFLYILYELIRLCHKKAYLQSDEYQSELAHSLKRLSDPAYAAMVTKKQPMDPHSVYYYQRHKKNR